MQKTAYEMRISDWSSDVCSSDLSAVGCPTSWIYGGDWRTPAKRRAPGSWPVRPIARPSVSRSLGRSEEHTSELQSLMRISYAVFCLKKKKKKTQKHNSQRE